jgi:hypothetical protein
MVSDVVREARELKIKLKQGIGVKFCAVSGIRLRTPIPLPRSWIWERGNSTGQYSLLGEEGRYQCGDARVLGEVSVWAHDRLSVSVSGKKQKECGECRARY